MKNWLFTLAVVFTLGLSTVTMNAEAAKRMGSGKSIGTQRQATVDKAPATPAQGSTAAAAPGAAAGAGAATGAGAAAATSRSWMGPIAGLAAGLGLAALASHLGFGDELASMLMIGLLAAGIMLVVGFVMRKRAAAQRSMDAHNLGGAGGMQYAPLAAGRPDLATPNPAYKVSMPGQGGSVIGSAIGSSTINLPADFDAASFERNAKVNFIRLQAAHDAGDLDDIRQFTTPEMFAELKMELAERGAITQKNDVVTIQTQVIDVEEGADRYVVSVRFTGLMRDDQGNVSQGGGSASLDEPFDEVWHLTKPRQGNSGWVLSGIQQVV